MAIDLKRSMKAGLLERHAIKDRLVVVAIDFGTTYSGYAFSFKEEFSEDPAKVNSPIWKEGKATGVTYETSTVALFDPNQEFHSFGFEADKKYGELSEQYKHNDWYYFKHFKMILYDNPDLDVRLELKDDKGNSMPAIEVFAKSIEYLKDKFLGEFENTKEKHPVKVEPRDIHWVITVPAIWNDNAKQFMREAAIHAGIHTDHLSLALEPEAAALFCQYIPVQRVGSGDSAEVSSFGPGDKYLILDAGGGTIDITVHEMQEDSTIKELYAANGGEWGGISIDKKYSELLNDIIGEDTMEIVAFRHKEDHLDLMANFEIKKKTINPESTGQITIKLPNVIFETYKTINGDKVLPAGDRIKSHLQGKVTFGRDKVRVDAEVMKSLFAETLECIVNHLSTIFDEREVKNVDKILMVGGFSESKMLQDAIRNHFKNKIVLVPEGSGLAVLSGAVQFGHCPTCINSRVCRFTYGVEATRDFQPGLDRPERRVIRKYNNTNYFLCDKTFSIHATKGESFEVGEPRGKHEYVPSEPGEKRLIVSVYQSERRMPIYIDESESTKVGDIEVILQESSQGVERPVTVEMIFGETELIVQLAEKKTGKKKEARFDCLRRESNA